MFRKMILKAAIIITAVLFCLSCSAAAEVNLIQNGDFRLIDEDGLPSDWYTDAYILEPGYTSFSMREGDNDHPYAAEIHNIGSNDARFAQVVEVEPDSMYLFSGYILADHVEGGHGANLSIEGVYAFSEKCYDTEGKWQYIRYYGETGPDQHYLTVFARLGGYSGESKGTAAFSDLSLIKVESIPGDLIADIWFRDTQEDTYNDTGDDNEPASSSSRLWIILVGLSYTLIAVMMLMFLHRKQNTETEHKPVKNIIIFIILALAFLFRVFISYFVKGYMVDVNCFTSWGYTMASFGPAQFYQATNFCDYPPLYTYILGLNSFVSTQFGNSENIARVVFRFIPSLCDIFACWMIYRIALKKRVNPYTGFVFLVFMAFNPSTILNSAAWGQMDSVLCLLLLMVAIYAMEGNWIISLPVYMLSVLVKPQALMLGPLGLVYIVITFIKKPEQRRFILYGTGISLLVLLIGVIPFSINQSWDWLLQLYGRTLASYPYATVNTANFYYLLGGNWSAVEKSANLMAPVLLAVFSTGYGLWWFRRSNNLPRFQTETIISLLFSLGFVLCAVLNASWAIVGVLAMASGRIDYLAYLGGLLFILLYVFGVKMHERYIFPALLLLAASWIYIRDRRILYLLILYSLTLFLNEGIVLDNSIRLGSQYGHLNQDTVWLADLISILNCAGAIYAAWLSIEILNPDPNRDSSAAKKAFLTAISWKNDRKLHWHLKDTIILCSITLTYTLISLLTLGSTKAPQTVWISSSPDEQIVFDLGENHNDFEMLYFAQVSRSDFSVSTSMDGVTWQAETWAQMDQGQCWKWKYVTEYYDSGYGERTYYNSDLSHIHHFSGRYIRLSACQLGLKLNEVLFRDNDGHILHAEIYAQSGSEPDSELFSDPKALIDEQDTMEKLPSIPEDSITASTPAQPSWWNSTYFDEIYHARTAYEFIQGSVPYETSHPPLGKILMSAFVAVFGMTPFGWRFAGALAGILMLPGMYLLGKQLTKKTYIGAFACLLMALDCMHLTQTQIATIDSFPVLFIIFAYFFMLRFVQTDFMEEKSRACYVDLACSGLFMGLSIASKWIGVYAGAGLAVLFFTHCFRVVSLHKESSEACRRKVITICLSCVAFFVIIPVVIYLISYIPYLAYKSKQIHSLGEYISEVWRSQIGMFNYHSTKNLGMDHPFYSPWWQWPIIGKPMYYASQQYIPADYPVHHSIFCFGNPVIWYGGLAALAFCICKIIFSRRYTTAGSDLTWHLRSESPDYGVMFILIGLLAQYLPWVLVPRGTYIYHYFASLPFLMLSICCVFNTDRKEIGKTVKTAGVFYLILAFVFFVILFPYASGMNVPSWWLNIGRNFLRIWY